MKDILTQYEELAKIQMECTYSGDYKNGNKASNKLDKLNKRLENGLENSKEIVEKLVLSDNPNVIIWIAKVAVDSGYMREEVLSKLKKISQNSQLGIIRFNAEMTLKTLLDNIINK